MFRPWHLSELISVLDARLVGEDLLVYRVHTDTRSLQQGDLFVALVGENFDGHDFLPQAAAAGAVAAVVQQERKDWSMPQLVVADTRLALGHLGHYNRTFYQGPLVALTGSSGKTTVKELLASICRKALGDDVVLATRGNLNNDLGVPMTLLELDDRHQLAIIELGASRPGEIDYTRALTAPQIVLINNAGMAHAGEFGGPEEIIRAKGEILDGLNGQGVAVLCLDDDGFADWQKRNSAGSLLTFSAGNAAADVHASEVRLDAAGCAGFVLHTPAGQARVQLQLSGGHNLMNALAAAAAALATGMRLENVVDGLESCQPVAGRCVRHELNDRGVLIDDSYNANPASMRAGMDLLAGMPGRRTLVLGDMGELGDWAEAEHRALGEYASDRADELLAVGPHMLHAVQAFAGKAQHFSSQQELLVALAGLNEQPRSYLVKGSRSAAMENVVAAILNADKGAS